MSDRVRFGFLALSLALRARCGTFDRAGAGRLIERGDRLSDEAGCAARAFYSLGPDDAARAGADLERFVTEMAATIPAPAPREFDWQRRADLS
ncbi:hypothetical protein [Palleronia sp.]|uniref:hypothetical protein n=1 Tax=Palleronia sp. TaxID=1940284 RepID=UPI0035C84AD0